MDKKNYSILGISAYYHDSAAAIVVDGEIVAAASEERFTRIKGDSSFPHHAIEFCLSEVNLRIEDVDDIVFYEDSVLKFERILSMSHLTSPRGLRLFLASMPKWLTSNLWMQNEIQKEIGIKKAISICYHHMSHAASAFYPSPFECSAILIVDGVGEWTSTSYGIGKGNKIKMLGESRFPNSLGLLYSAFTYYCGFRINFGEYKLMGLAPYGKPVYTDIIKKNLIHICEDGSILLNQKYFAYTYSLRTINKKFEELFGKAAREPETPLTEHEMNIAASIQEVTNEIILKLAEYVRNKTHMENIVLAGGVALNVVSMGYLERNSGYKRMWIQPASGDAGGALGAALWQWYLVRGNERKVKLPDSMKGAYLGVDILDDSIQDDKLLAEMGAVWESIDKNNLAKRVASLLSEGNVIGIARGRMEWGPRALGNRSILGSAIDEHMQERMNLKIKFRESFRPFAPIVLLEDMEKYFEMGDESPYMLKTYYVRKERRVSSTIGSNDIRQIVNTVKSDIPAVTHLDYSSRVQTVDKDRNPFLFDLLKEYKDMTGYSVLVNTSFNIRGEPIVCDVKDAFKCFLSTDMDYVVIGNRLMDKKKQNLGDNYENRRKEWTSKFELD